LKGLSCEEKVFLACRGKIIVHIEEYGISCRKVKCMGCRTEECIDCKEEFIACREEFIFYEK